MAIDYAKIFISHVRNVSKANKWLTEGEAVPTYRSWIRAEQLLRLDVVLIKHRERYSAPWEPLFDRMELLIFLRPVTAGHLSK
jgi:hypothetical protein